MLKSVQKRKNRLRTKRKARVRGKIRGNESCPRVSVFRSNRYIYAQAIDDTKGHTLVAVDGAVMKLKSNIDDAKKIAQEMGSRLKDKGIESIVFDRNGYLYHGVVAAFADGLREAGIKF